MLTGLPPSWDEETDPIKLMNLIANTKEIPEYPEDISEEAISFLDCCLNRNPRERHTARDLLRHPFICFPDSNFPKSNLKNPIVD